MFFLDPMWFVFMIPALLFALWAQYKVKSTFKKYSKVQSMHRMTGAEVAQLLMRREGLDYLGVNTVPGHLSDFYNPADKSINLSQGSTEHASVGAMAVVAHELGHALQDKEGYLMMRVRSSIVPVANLGSNLGVWLIFLGIILGGASGPGTFGYSMALLGLILFSAAVLFTIVTLPVELNASKRAHQMLTRHGLVSAEEQRGVGAVLNAAALTYIAAMAQAVAQLLYFAFILFGGRGDD